jgi:hypothetical protein
MLQRYDSRRTARSMWGAAPRMHDVWVNQISASSNLLTSWLRQLERLRTAANYTRARIILASRGGSSSLCDAAIQG